MQNNNDKNNNDDEMGGLTLLRYQIFLACGILFLACWYTALLNQDEILNVVASSSTSLSGTASNNNSVIAIARIIVQYAPIWAILILALYALLSVLYGVATFRDCPEAALELDHQIREAKIELKKRGIPL